MKTSSHDLAHTARAAAGGHAPGKAPATARLSPRPLVFRVESAEAARELGAAFAPHASPTADARAPGPSTDRADATLADDPLDPFAVHLLA